jgi:ssDNA-binding Zn-finger/Zn-ribbon topoisomerase 1
MRYWLKECPKCHGDLRKESDIYGEFIACLQCGYTLKADEELELEATGTLKVVAVPVEVARAA